MSRYCVTFPLKMEKYQEDILDKRFEIGRKIYNAVLGMVHKRYRCLVETKAYRQLRQQIKDADEKSRKPLYKELNEMYKWSRLNEYSLHEDVKPNNFKPDGTIKKGRLIWKKSNRYKKAQSELKELYRKQADIREYRHQQMSNYILSLGDTIYVEDMSFKRLQRRSKKTEVNGKTGKIKKKKRFGKSLANKAPAKLLTLLDNKLKYFGKELIRVSSKEVKASQYNHLNGEYNKKSLSQRWNDLDGMKVQRDLYSAFLIQHVADDHKSINKEFCIKDFEKFMVLHDNEIEQLRNSELKQALKNVV